MKKHFSVLVCTLVLLAMTGCAVSSKTANPVMRNTIVFPVDSSKTLPVSGFMTLGNDWTSGQTEVAIQRNSDGIRIHFRCYADTAKMRFSKQEKDDNMNLFGGEHVELLLAPNGLNDGIYYHIAINPAGSMYHAKKRDISWTPAYDLKIDKSNTFWDAVLFLPYYTLGVTQPPRNTVWLANFCRTYAPIGGIMEHSSYSGARNFHDFNTMTRVIFDGKAPDAALHIRAIYQTPDGNIRVVAGRNGCIPAKIEVLLDGKPARSMPFTGKEFTEHSFLIPVTERYVPLKNKRMVQLRLTDQKGNLLEEKTGFLDMGKKTFLLLDKYVYFKNDPIHFEVQTVPGIFRIKQEQKTIAQQEITNRKWFIKHPLPPGRYVAEYESGYKYTTRVFMVKEQPPAQSPAMPDNFTISGTELKLNGKPFYIFATSGGKVKNYPYHPSFNCNYGPGARKNSISRVNIPYKQLVRKPKTGYLFFHNWEQRLEQFIKARKKQKSANLYCLLAYEANLKAYIQQPDKSLLETDAPAMYQKVYMKLKQDLPHLKLALQIDSLTRLKEYAKSCDILETATYTGSYHGSNLMRNLKQDLLHVRKTVYDKPVIFWLGGSIPDPYCRTAEEIRAGVYCSILNGAAGNIVHMGHGGVPVSRSRFWSMLAALPREIDSFYGDLKTWEEVKDFVIPAGMDGKAVISPDGELLLVLLNNTLSEKKVALELPGTYGKRTMTFTPLEPRVLRIKKK